MDQNNVREFCKSIADIGHIMKRLNTRESEDRRYYPAFGMMFRSAEEAEGTQRVRMTDISSTLHITKPAATYIVKQLADRHLVERAVDQNDHRITYIVPTAEGSEVFGESLNRQVDLFARAASRMGDENQAVFYVLFKQFLEALNQEMEES